VLRVWMTAVQRAHPHCEREVMEVLAGSEHELLA
jgi:hypothetical protein